MSEWHDKRKLKVQIGEKWGKLTILAEAGRTKIGERLVKCRCDCGKITHRRSTYIKDGSIVSCGCYTRGVMKGRKLGYWRKTKHGTPDNSARMGIYTHYKCKAKRFGQAFNLKPDEFATLTKMNCHYCGDSPNQVYNFKGSRGVVPITCLWNGVDRVDNTRGYELDNVVPCCKRCNAAKNTMSLDEFRLLIGKIWAKFNGT